MPNTEINPQSRPALAPKVRLQTDQVTGKTVLLYPEGLLQLNSTAQAVVSRCDGKISVDDILCSLGEEYEVGVETLRSDVSEIFSELHQRRLLVFNL
ncbi:MAG: pyrroloquinoline quinone biosynthesis peptide chaperone PqqD [Chthoniobacterales bacterium]|nr:pyrroloquinoline quinone biosynthesis peptide chaperone PqqD [Chthoniobacterales bacterium]